MQGYILAEELRVTVPDTGVKVFSKFANTS